VLYCTCRFESLSRLTCFTPHGQEGPTALLHILQGRGRSPLRSPHYPHTIPLGQCAFNSSRPFQTSLYPAQICFCFGSPAISEGQSDPGSDFTSHPQRCIAPLLIPARIVLVRSRSSRDNGYAQHALNRNISSRQ
jgi:hypothetical protein